VRKKISTPELELAVVGLIGYRRQTIVPNVSWGLGFRHECDLVVLNPDSGYLAEIELKISVADFRADLKKNHSHDSIYLRKLSYAMPEDVMEKVRADVPERAGIISVKRDFRGICVARWERQAKLNRNAVPLPADMKAHLYHLAAMRIWSLKAHLNNQRFSALREELQELRRHYAQSQPEP